MHENRQPWLTQVCFQDGAEAEERQVESEMGEMEA